MSSISFVPTQPNDFGGVVDQMLHPVTLDYVRTANGEWQQTADSRTTMLIALSIELGASPFDPDQGSAIAQLMRDGDLVSPEMVQSEVLRVGASLAGEGVLSDLTVAVRDEPGVPADKDGAVIIELGWHDLASGSPINEVFTSR